MSAALPPIALAVRQPWAHAIIHLGKTLENRSRHAVSLGGMQAVVGQRICIMASKTMRQLEYTLARDFMLDECGVLCPEPWLLERGGIIGTVTVTDIVKESADPWFMGPCALVLAEPAPCPFVACSGELGMFRWKPSKVSEPVPLARWMRPPTDTKVSGLARATATQEEMF